MKLFTIGHSNHTPEKFIRLLQSNQINSLVDVRSKPYSRWVPFANRENLEKLLAPLDIHYLYLGNLLGGLVPGLKSTKKADRLVAYDCIRHEDYFTGGIDRLIEEIKKQRTCILCAEENPAACHRRLLVGASIAAQGVKILHIRSDGRVQPEEELVFGKEQKIDNNQMQLDL